MTNRSDPVPRWPYAILLGLHLVAVLTGPALYLVAVAPNGWSFEGAPDANIGGALAIMWTALFALPWSVPVWMAGDIDGWTGNVNELVYTALALLNVLLHAGLARWHHRRAVRRSQPTGELRR